MVRSESGTGSLRTLVTLAVLAGIAYVAVKTVPFYVANYQLQDYIRQLAVQATIQRTPAETLRQNVVGRANDLGLGVTNDDVKVTAVNGNVNINLDYRVPVALGSYVVYLHFTPSAENRAL